MSFITLFSDERHWLATDQSVFDADESVSVNDAVDQLQALALARKEFDNQRETVLSEAREAGYADGFAKGLDSARKLSLEKIETLQANYKARVNEQQLAIKGLALAVVRKIAGQVASEDWLIAQALQAVSELDEDSAEIRLVVSDSKASSVREKLHELQDAGTSNAARLGEVVGEVDCDDHLCELHTPFGSISIDIETQLAAIATVLSGSR